MKRNYIAPEMEIVEIELETIVSMSVGINTEDQGDEKDDFAHQRRGTWGNLWK